MKKEDNLKKYFSGAFAAEALINKLGEDIAVLRSKQAGSRVKLSHTGRNTTNHKRNEEISIAVMELEEEIAKAKFALLELEKEIKNMTDTLTSHTARAVIIWRYVCRYKWKDIAERAEMSEMQVIREHNAAMVHMTVAAEDDDFEWLWA
jgi:DNA-directed RNA polymerase specialized sigma subunit